MTTNSRSEIDLFDVLTLLWVKRWVVLGITTGAMLLAVLVVVLSETTWRADVVIMQNRESAPTGLAALAGELGGLGALAGLQTGGGGFTTSARGVLESRMLTRTFIERHNLTDLFFDHDETPTLERAVGRFNSSVRSVSEDARTGLITLSMEWTDADVAAHWANEYVALANEVVRERALENARLNIEYVHARLAESDFVEVRQVLYGLLESETKRAMLATGKPDYAFSVIDPAFPPQNRASPRPFLWVAAGLVFGFALSAFVLLFMHGWRSRNVER